MSDGVVYSFLFGFLPVFFWLWFWIKEDCHPEPRRAILKTFFFGMLAVPLALSLEGVIYKFLSSAQYLAFNSFLFIGVLAGIEEIMKYQAAKYGAFRSSYFDEPIDALVYMITAALGFAALENAIFVFKNAQVEEALIGASSLIFISGMRFLGATLLHTLSSAIVGSFLIYSFRQPKTYFKNLVLGIFLASVLHALFNFYILKAGFLILAVFGGIWLMSLFLLLFFKRVRDDKI